MNTAASVPSTSNAHAPDAYSSPTSRTASRSARGEVLAYSERPIRELAMRTSLRSWQGGIAYLPRPWLRAVAALYDDRWASERRLRLLLYLGQFASRRFGYRCRIDHADVCTALGLSTATYRKRELERDLARLVELGTFGLVVESDGLHVRVPHQRTVPVPVRWLQTIVHREGGAELGRVGLCVAAALAARTLFLREGRVCSVGSAPVASIVELLQGGTGDDRAAVNLATQVRAKLGVLIDSGWWQREAHPTRPTHGPQLLRMLDPEGVKDAKAPFESASSPSLADAPASAREMSPPVASREMSPPVASREMSPPVASRVGNSTATDVLKSPPPDAKKPNEFSGLRESLTRSDGKSARISDTPPIQASYGNASLNHGNAEELRAPERARSRGVVSLARGLVVELSSKTFRSKTARAERSPGTDAPHRRRSRQLDFSPCASDPAAVVECARDLVALTRPRGTFGKADVLAFIAYGRIAKRMKTPPRNLEGFVRRCFERPEDYPIGIKAEEEARTWLRRYLPEWA